MVKILFASKKYQKICAEYFCVVPGSERVAGYDVLLSPLFCYKYDMMRFCWA